LGEKEENALPIYALGGEKKKDGDASADKEGWNARGHQKASSDEKKYQLLPRKRGRKLAEGKTNDVTILWRGRET